MSRIEIRELAKQWDRVVAVHQVSFTVAEGSLTVLLGPSGCGKSTILRLVAGLETVSSGSIAIGENELTHMDLAKRGVSMVFQSYALFPHLKLRAEMRDEICFLQQKLGLTMVYVTHDQVVVLRKGSVEQTGRPHELYELPRMTFAAQFMGSSPMNLLKLDLIEARSELAAACGGILPTDRLTDGYIGVRPEHVQVGHIGLPVRVSATDYLGAETVLRMAHGRQPIEPDRQRKGALGYKESNGYALKR